MKRPTYSPFRASLHYLFRSRFYILAAFCLFLLSALFSFFFPSLFTGLDETLRNLAHQADGLSGFQLFLFIFHNNLMSSFFALFLGFFLGIIPLSNALLNGAVLGYVLARSIPIAGWTVIVRLLPHGVFELPAIFIAIGLGMQLGFSFFRRNGLSCAVEHLRDSLRVFLFFILPLLLIAASIEAALIIFF